MFNHREQVLDRVHKDSMVIVAGETGSGKSTQVPQFLLEVRQGHEKIAYLLPFHETPSR